MRAYERKRPIKTNKRASEDNMIKQIIDLPDGWTCIGCGDEYLQDTEGELVADYTEGTLCKKCNSEDNMKEYKLSITLGDKAYVCENNVNDEDVIIAEFDGYDEAVKYIDNNFKKIRDGNNYHYYIKTNKQARII